MKFAFVLAVLAVAVASSALADVYMHNPRGSNNRCDERNADAQNQDRLFNSQNNAAGGYPVGPPMYFYTGSVLTFEWHHQHSCGDENKVECEIVWQYMCGPGVKDGQPTTPDGSTQETCITEVTAANENQDNVGRHESSTYFDKCNNRQRNQGLFLADENVNNGAGAQSTRQNNNGNTNGFECQEERDYYPYWHPTPWVDIAVLTSNYTYSNGELLSLSGLAKPAICKYYEDESENVKPRFECDCGGTPANCGPNQRSNTRQSCEGLGFQWVSTDNTQTSKGAPRDTVDCQPAPWSRDNQLGNAYDGYLASYNWTLPDDPNPYCVVRLRYNMSSTDYDPWSGIDASSNGNNSPVKDDPVMMFGDLPLQLAINTNQFGRTFQDRSHAFEIRDRADAPEGNLGLSARDTIINLNVRGKRGNIAQVRNCVEYDFVPQRTLIKPGDWIHFQWTGSNHEPDGHDGEGRNRWDRSNIVQIRGNDLRNSYFQDWNVNAPDNLFEEEAIAYRAAMIGQGNGQYSDGTTAACDNSQGNLDDDQSTTNCARLNNAEGTFTADPTHNVWGTGEPTPYFDLGVIKMNNTGEYHFMSTRNNNFSNRSQKATIIVKLFFVDIGLVLLIAGFVVAGIVVGALVLLGGAGLVLLGVALIGGGGAALGRNGGKYRRTSSRRSIGSGGSGVSGQSASGRSRGTRRSAGSKSSFGGSMI